MNIYLIIAILLANLIAIAIVYQIIKSLPKKQLTIFIAASVATMYVLVSIVYYISGFGIDNQVNQQAKSFITYLFVPVNMILLVPYIAISYMKMIHKKINKERFIKRCMTIIAIAIIILVIEFFYFRNVQTNILEIKNNAIEANKIEEQNANENSMISNEENINIVLNETPQNGQTNTRTQIDSMINTNTNY